LRKALRRRVAARFGNYKMASVPCQGVSAEKSAVMNPWIPIRNVEEADVF
jgi:hypothetical protein